MPQTKQAMSEAVKQEIMAELQSTRATSYDKEFDQQMGDTASTYTKHSYHYDRALVDGIKQEILNEMQYRQKAEEQEQKLYHNQQYDGGKDMLMSHGGYRQKLDAADKERMKREILMELQGEMREHREYHHPDRDGMYYGAASGSRYGMHPYDRVVVDSIKQELLAEMEARQAVRQAQAYGYGHLVSDQNLNKMIDQRYQTMRDIKQDLRKEIEVIRNLENQKSLGADPYVGELAYSIVREARQQGVPLDEVLKKLDSTSGVNGAKGNWRERAMQMLNTGQRKGFLYGVGAALLAAMVLPAAKQNMHSVAVRTIEEGMELADRARSMVSRAKEEVEDIIAEANFKSLQDDVNMPLHPDEPDITVLED